MQDLSLPLEMTKLSHSCVATQFFHE